MAFVLKACCRAVAAVFGFGRASGGLSRCRINQCAPLIAFFVFLPPACLHAQEAVGQQIAFGRIDKLKGSAMVKRLGVMRTLAAEGGMEVRLGDTVSVSNGSSLQITFIDGSFVNAGPGSALRSPQYVYDPETGRRRVFVKALAGRFRFIVKNSGIDSSYRVETETASIDTSGADFVITVDPEGTHAATLGNVVYVNNALPVVVGGVGVGVNQKTYVKKMSPPSPPVYMGAEERKKLVKETIIR